MEDRVPLCRQDMRRVPALSRKKKPRKIRYGRMVVVAHPPYAFLGMLHVEDRPTEVRSK